MFTSTLVTRKTTSQTPPNAQAFKKVQTPRSLVSRNNGSQTPGASRSTEHTWPRGQQHVTLVQPSPCAKTSRPPRTCGCICYRQISQARRQAHEQTQNSSTNIYTDASISSQHTLYFHLQRERAAKEWKKGRLSYRSHLLLTPKSNTIFLLESYIFQLAPTCLLLIYHCNRRFARGRSPSSTAIFISTYTTGRQRHNVQTL